MVPLHDAMLDEGFLKFVQKSGAGALGKRIQCPHGELRERSHFGLSSVSKSSPDRQRARS